MKTIFRLLKNLYRDFFDNSGDPVKHCVVYKDKDYGSCSHVDGPLCNFPNCPLIREYHLKKIGRLIYTGSKQKIPKEFS